MDIVDLREFYGSRLGLTTRRALSACLKPRLEGIKGSHVLGLGYATPYLGDCVPSAETRIALMLARQGVFRWPDDGAVQAALVAEYDLPLLESGLGLALGAQARG